MLALIDGIQPRVLTLKMILEEYIKHRQEVIKKRTEYDLAKAKDRAHILEGLKMALTKIDAIVKTIKQSKDKEVAKINLIKKFKLSERQAVAILEMRLQQLANMERLKIEQELKEKLALIKELESILKSAKKILEEAGVDINKKVQDWTDDEQAKIRTIIGDNVKVEGELRSEVQMNIKRLMDIGSYRGIRHRLGLPLRGQRTKNNSRTRKGKKKTVANKKKAVK